MRILGLDISSQSTGWALLEDGAVLDFGVIKMRQPTHGERLVYFETRLKEILEASVVLARDVDLIAIEDVWVGKFALPAMILSRYRGIAEKVCWEWFRTEPLVRTATDFRKLLGLKYGVNLLPGKKEKLKTGKDSKQLTFELMCKVFDLKDRKLDFDRDNDMTDALAVALAAHLLGTDLGKQADQETAEKKAAQRAKKKEKRAANKEASSSRAVKPKRRK